jgi:hypothetical protein
MLEKRYNPTGSEKARKIPLLLRESNEDTPKPWRNPAKQESKGSLKGNLQLNNSRGNLTRDFRERNND